MRWLTFILFTGVFLALQTGLTTLWYVQSHDITPSLLLILLVFIGLWAAPMKLVWAALILGLLVDLTTFWPQTGATGDLAILGPSALGFLVGAYVCLQLRGLVFRDSTISMIFIVFGVGLFIHLAVVGVVTVRGWNIPGLPWLAGSPVRDWHPADELLSRFFRLLYTCALAMPVGWMLIKSRQLWGFNISTVPGLHPPRRNP
ncbi:MAG: hypothetical protein WD042_16130 [Phycisphaeraceae bacterium]